MKISIIINSSWNIYNFRRGLVAHFLSRGDSVVAIAPRDEYSEKLVQMGCTYRALEMEGSGMNPLADLGLIWRILRILQQERPDVILTYTIKPNIYASLAGGWLGIPCICNVSGLGTVFLWKGYVRSIARLLYRAAFRSSSWIFFQNDEDRRDFLREVRIDHTRTGLLPGSGINVAHFQPVETHHEPVVFLMIARLLVEKGVYDFIEAVKIMKAKGAKAVFRLVGDLNETHSRSIKAVELEDWIAQGLVEYMAHVEDIRPVIAKADVVVLPSYREGTPRTLLEGGAMGKALLATDVAGCRHVVEDGRNGFLCKLKNPADLASKMKLYLALTRDERVEMSNSARKSIVSRFDETLVIDQYRDKVDELVKRNLN